MISSDPPARIPQLPREHRSAAAQRALDVFALPGHINVDGNHVLNTLAQHPEVAELFLVFNRYLLKSSTLPVRWRQIAIMRVAWLKKSRYIWSSHLRTSQRAGLEEGIFDPVKHGAAAPYWNEEEKIILQATDQLTHTTDLDDQHWQALSEILNQQQVLDFLFTLGAYIQMSMVTNALRIDREQALLELAEKYGAPED